LCQALPHEKLRQEESVVDMKTIMSLLCFISHTYSYKKNLYNYLAQPNRAVRTSMLRGVGGAPCEGRPYPDGPCLYLRTEVLTFTRITQDFTLTISPLHQNGLLDNKSQQTK